MKVDKHLKHVTLTKKCMRNVGLVS